MCVCMCALACCWVCVAFDEGAASFPARLLLMALSPARRPVPSSLPPSLPPPAPLWVPTQCSSSASVLAGREGRGGGRAACRTRKRRGIIIWALAPCVLMIRVGTRLCASVFAPGAPALGCHADDKEEEEEEEEEVAWVVCVCSVLCVLCLVWNLTRGSE